MSGTTGHGVRSPNSNLVIRLLALGVLIFLCNAWITSNLDEHINAALVANGIMVIMTLVGMLKDYLDKRRAQAADSQLQQFLLFFLRTPVLVGLYFVFLVIGSLFGSISVSSEGLVIHSEVRVAPSGKPLQAAASKVVDGQTTLVRFLEWTTPFGRPYAVQVDGYVPTGIELYPWVGTRIRVASDLTPSPSLLIRIHYSRIEIVNGAKLTLRIDSTLLGSATLDAAHWAVLVGRQDQRPSTLVDKWLLEFKANNVPEELASRSLLGWGEPLTLRPNRSIVPGMIVSITLESRTGALMSTQKYLVGSDKIQDVVVR